jgi:spore germination protein KC
MGMVGLQAEFVRASFAGLYSRTWTVKSYFKRVREMSGGMPFMRRYLTLLALVCIASLATGCYDKQELEEQAFVTTLGVDPAPNGFIDCTFRIALPRNPSSEGGKAGKSPLAGTGPITFRAHTITEALLLANSSVERTMSLTHLGSIFFSEDIAKLGLNPQVQAMVRYREFRPTILVAVCKGTAKEILSADTPMLEQSASRTADSIALVGRRTGLIPVVYLHDLTSALESKHAAVMLPIFSVNQSVKDDPKGKQGIEQKQVDFQAGQVSRSGGNPVEWMGAAIFKQDKMLGEISGRDMIHLRMLQGQLKTTKLDFPDPSQAGFVSLSVRRERNPRYIVDLANAGHVSVDVPLEAEILSIQTGTDYTNPVERHKLEQYLDQQLAGQLTDFMHRTLQQQGADVIPLSNTVRRQFATHAAYSAYPWEEKLKQANLEVKVDLHIRRFGVQLNPMQGKK